MTNSEALGIKKALLKTIIQSGFNISPETLDFIIKLPDPNKEIKLIFKKSPSVSDSNNHLTKSLLKKIIYKNKEYFSQKTVESLNDEEKTSQEQSRLKIENTRKILRKDKQQTIATTERESPELAITTPAKIKKKSQYAGAKSSLNFNPLAKEFDSELKILKDPTGKIFTNGEYDDFYNLTMNKYEVLRKLMKNRSEVHSASNIKNIIRIPDQTEVSAIGLVKSIRKTKKGNYFMDLEDHTGEIGVLINKNIENEPEFKNLVEKIIEDQLLYIQGQYSPNNSQQRGIIYANYITKIDLPTDFTPNTASEELSIALLSDSHIGSKEFEEKLFLKFIKFLTGDYGNSKIRAIAGKVKYIIINGDLIDGVGVYPNQKEDLNISDIFKQYKYCSELISQIPEYITIIYSSGNHEPVRNAIPRPAVPKKYCNPLKDLEVVCVGNPCLIQTHSVNSLVFHGDSMLDLNMLVPSLQNDNPVNTMKELLICRHLAPVFGKKTQIAPVDKDWLIIDKIPDIFHTGHVHINGLGSYRNVTLVNSGCFQSQTDFMKSFGINPTPGIVPVVNLKSYEQVEFDFKKTI